MHKSYDERLNTFNTWPNNAPNYIKDLAEAGFWFTGEGDLVQCFACGLRISNWKEDEIPLHLHEEKNKSCRYLVERLQRTSSNEPTYQNTTTQVTSSNQNLSNTTNRLANETMKLESQRYRSFSSCPVNKHWPAVEDLAHAGFYWIDSENCTKCYCCGVMFDSWESTDQDITRRHRAASTQCTVANDTLASNSAIDQTTIDHNDLSPVFDDEVYRAFDKLAVNSLPHQESSGYNQGKVNNQHVYTQDQHNTTESSHFYHTTSLDSSSFPSISTVSSVSLRRPQDDVRRPAEVYPQNNPPIVKPPDEYYPNFAELSDYAKRLKTFTTWPQNVPIQPHELCEAGFYYTKKDDSVKCYLCNLGLKSWEPGDTAWAEHVKYSYACPLVEAKLKGETYFNDQHPAPPQLPPPHPTNPLLHNYLLENQFVRTKPASVFDDRSSSSPLPPQNLPMGAHQYRNNPYQEAHQYRKNPYQEEHQYRNNPYQEEHQYRNNPYQEDQNPLQNYQMTNNPPFQYQNQSSQEVDPLFQYQNQKYENNLQNNFRKQPSQESDPPNYYQKQTSQESGPPHHYREQPLYNGHPYQQKEIDASVVNRETPPFIGNRDTAPVVGIRDTPLYGGNLDTPPYAETRDTPLYGGNRDTPSYYDKVTRDSPVQYKHPFFTQETDRYRVPYLPEPDMHHQPPTGNQPPILNQPPTSNHSLQPTYNTPTTNLGMQSCNPYLDLSADNFPLVNKYVQKEGTSAANDYVMLRTEQKENNNLTNGRSDGRSPTDKDAFKKRENPYKNIPNNSANNKIETSKKRISDSDIDSLLELGYHRNIIEKTIGCYKEYSPRSFKSRDELMQAVMFYQKSNTLEGTPFGRKLNIDASVDKSDFIIDAAVFDPTRSRDDNQKTCVVCFDNEVEVTFIPCGHLCVCTSCAYGLTDCPICRKHIESSQRTYLP